jgi:hypothetical protein
MPETADKDSTSGKSGIMFTKLVLFAALLPLVYIMSFGPIDYFGLDSIPAVRALYAPITPLYLNFPPFRIVFDCYMIFWDKNW